MSDAQQTLGQFLTDEHTERDAIHIALLPVIAGEDVSPGQTLRFAYGSTSRVLRCEEHYNDVKDIVGIADPFIKGWDIPAGTRFWMFMLPNTVTGMRHEWKHPAVDDRPATTENEHELWLRQYAESNSFDYDELIACLTAGDGYVCSRGVDNDAQGPSSDVWEHFEALKGNKYDAKHRDGVAYTCSC